MMRPARPARRGVAATELAFVLPLLALLFAIGIDWGRIFYYSITVDNCARNGALWASDPFTPVKSPYKDITAAALADAPNLSPQPTVTTATGTSADGYRYVDCTVTYPFTTFTKLPGTPTTTMLTRTVRAFVAPATPY